MTSKLRVASELVKDDYGNKISVGQEYLSGRFLEKTRYPETYIAQKEITCFYKETIIYPFVQCTISPRGHIITDADLCQVIAHGEQNCTI